MARSPFVQRATPAVAVAALILVGACGGNTTPAVVEDPVPTTLTISPAAVAFSFLGEARALSGIVRDQNNAPIESSVTWASSDPAAVTIDAAGLATAVANGSSLITATAAGLTDTLTIQVEVAPRSIVVQQGDDQEAVAGNALPDSILVTVLDLGGAPIEGAEVFFRPGSSAGTVRDSVVLSRADGTASTIWTLGPDFGPLELSVVAGGVERVLSSFSRSDTPIADLVFASTLTLSRLDPTPFDSLTVSATVLNQGDLTTGGTFRVSAVVGGVELAFVDEAVLTPDEEREVSITFDGLTTGAQDVVLELDRGDALPELIESNNELSRSVNVLQQAQISLGVPVTGLSASVGEELLFVLEVPPGSGDALNIDIIDPVVGAIDDLDLFVAQGSRPAFREDYPDCVSANPRTSESCQIVFPEGTYHILLHAWQDESGSFPTTGFSDVTLEVTIGNTILPYDLDYTLISDFSPSQEQAIDDAITYWQEIIRGNLTSVEDTPQLLNPCGTGEPSLSSVDDMHVFVGTLPAEDQDGPGGVLASAGPCAIRPITNLPFLGVARFDPGDLDVLNDEEVFRIMLHEIGHTLGIGATWELEGLLQDPSTEGSGSECQQREGFQDTYYTGDGARAAFLDVGGGSYSGGAIVPVANVESCGSADSHWREGVFDTELMTPGFDSGLFNPLSVVSVRSLEDLGYGVDASRAEAYSLPPSGPLTAAPITSVVLDLRNDVMPIRLDAIGPKHIRRGTRK